MIWILLILLVFALAFLAFILFWGGKNEDDNPIFEEIRNPLIMQILVPRENEKASLAAEQMFASIHGILENYKRCPDLVSLEIASNEEDGIRIYVIAPQHLSRFIEGQIYAQYPNADIQYVEDYTRESNPSGEIFVTTGEIEMEIGRAHV